MFMNLEDMIIMLSYVQDVCGLQQVIWIVFGLQGPFDAAFFNVVFGSVYDQRETLLRASLLLRPGTWQMTPPPRDVLPAVFIHLSRSGTTESWL
jgi:hypothetical protein